MTQDFHVGDVEWSAFDFFVKVRRRAIKRKTVKIETDVMTKEKFPITQDCKCDEWLEMPLSEFKTLLGLK